MCVTILHEKRAKNENNKNTYKQIGNECNLFIIEFFHLEIGENCN